VSDAAHLEALAATPCLAGIPPDELASIAARGHREVHEPGSRIFGELEPTESVAIVLRGRVRIVLAAGEPGETTIAEVGPGAPLGEIGLLTGRLATATALAVETTEVLRLPRDVVWDVMGRFPTVARSFAKILAERIAETDGCLTRVLRGEHDALAQVEGARRAAAASRRRPLAQALRAAFREVVLEHRAELPFVFLSGFIAALAVARIVVIVGDVGAHGFRTIYVAGLLLLVATGAGAHFVFHRTARRLLCAAYGAALGLIANQLSVLLDFDVFYLDMTTLDPDAAAKFSYRALYDRAPTRTALALVIALAIQATYLRPFWRRAAFLIWERVRGVFRGR
jgi:CRP-like cAMP-binding protein